MTKPDINLDKYVLQALTGLSEPIRMRELIRRAERIISIEAPDLFATSKKEYGGPGWDLYRQCEASARRLKDAGKVELVRGKGSGWRLPLEKS